MSRVLTFRTTYPPYHTKAGEPTYFVEKLWESVGLPRVGYTDCNVQAYLNYSRFYSDKVWPKGHTIRAGHRFKAGDVFSPRIWSGKPYGSYQISIAPDVEVKKTWDFSMTSTDFILDGRSIIGSHLIVKTLAYNDGFDDWRDFFGWFTRPFEGQVICWDARISYDI